MTHLRACAGTTLLLLLSGCALFMGDETKSAGIISSFPWSKKPAETPPDNAPILKMARLEASIVSRPVNDSRIRRHVWEELDESGLMAPEIRGRLNQSGFRIGVAGSATPWALQSLAQEAVRAHRSQDQSVTAQSGSAVGPAFSLMPGGTSVLEVQSQLDGRKLPLSRLAELSSLRDYEGLRCVFEVSVRELSDEWVLLNVLPQIHSGAIAPRLSVTDISEQLPMRQNVLPLYDQQFTLKLLTGEVAVIGRLDSSDWNPGKLFFQPESGAMASERLLMIRMVGVEKLKGQSDPGFRLEAFEK